MTTTTTATTKQGKAAGLISSINNNTRLINFLTITGAITILLSLPITLSRGSEITILQAAALIIAISPLITISFLIGRGHKLCATYFQMMTIAAFNKNTVFFDNKPYKIATINADQGTLTLQDGNGIKINTSLENVTLDKKDDVICLPWWI